jgi:ergothioneine biosynthesis protein EgtB
MLERYHRIRSFSERLAEPLSPEDCTLQSMDDASPIRWHLAHTTWFFETFVLGNLSGYQPFCPAFEQLFNSYYNTVGKQFPRGRRGLLSRPSQAQVIEYRAYVDEHIGKALRSGKLTRDQQTVLEVGLQHEQQHQELMLTDIKHALSSNPLLPAYHTITQASPAVTDAYPAAPRDANVSDPNASEAPTGVRQFARQQQALETSPSAPLAVVTANVAQWVDGLAGLREIGNSNTGFAFDNERPKHSTFLQAHQLAQGCVTNGQYLEFIEAGGYQQPEWWLSLGWNCVQQQGWSAPLYWRKAGQGWEQFTLAGLQPIELEEPVCHVSFFEADAFARWAGCRLPTEAEWEVCVQNRLTIDPSADSTSLDGYWSDRLLSIGRTVQPQRLKGDSQVVGLENALGNLWEWTASPYTGYPGFTTLPGALGEYNGKFMCNQFVLRGGSCATPSDHLRVTYRNFFPPETRWQFSGIRLARMQADD